MNILKTLLRPERKEATMIAEKAVTFIEGAVSHELQTILAEVNSLKAQLENALNANKRLAASVDEAKDTIARLQAEAASGISALKQALDLGDPNKTPLPEPLVLQEPIVQEPLVQGSEPVPPAAAEVGGES